jgi:hypothetical protein
MSPSGLGLLGQASSLNARSRLISDDFFLFLLFNSNSHESTEDGEPDFPIAWLGITPGQPVSSSHPHTDF